jgi:hypothetical protein
MTLTSTRDMLTMQYGNGQPVSEYRLSERFKKNREILHVLNFKITQIVRIHPLTPYSNVLWI